VVARARDAVLAFQKAWEREWIGRSQSVQSAMNQLPPGVAIMGNTRVLQDPRLIDVHCYFGRRGTMIRQVDHSFGLDPMERKIGSRVNDEHWVCPNWLPPKDYYLSGPDIGDERLSIDNAIAPHGRAAIHGSRSVLIRHLAQAVGRAPRDSVLIGQYVRMLIDNDQLPEALVVADNCQARPSWCLALRGHVSYKLGQMFDAEDAFLQSIDALRADETCTFTSIRSLLDDEERSAYTRLPCARQDSVNKRMWWLADPLWSVPGNDRFIEHYSRKVTIALHAALGRDERYNWTPYAGGDALAEMIERYGWMSYTYYGHTPVQTVPDLKDIYSRMPKDIAERRRARALGGQKTTFEYSIGRVHVVPPMTMVNDPFSITNADWSMNAPVGTSWDFTFNWWPVEHYVPLHPLGKIPDQQTAFLRRQDSTLLAYATHLGRTELERKLGDTVTGVLLASTGPGSIRRLEEKQVESQNRLTFLSALSAGPSLVSVEVPWTATGQRAARSRFGVRPPPPLSEMQRGETAMSEPVILIIPANVTALPNLADSAVALMNGSTMLAAGTTSLGVYWETYGIAAGDSIEITVTVRPRAGGSPVTSSWREPQPGRSVRTIPGAVPIQMRSLILDVGALPVGPYEVEIAVQRGNSTIRSSRDVTIR
jgi:hypothetical protein